MRVRTFLPTMLMLATAGGLVACHDDPAVSQPDLAQQPDLAPAPPDMLLPDRDPTDHPAALQLTNYGGGTIAAMEPYTIVWKGDEVLGQKVDTFVSWLVQSDYWVGVTGEYGGSKGTGQGLIVLDDAAPATLDDSQMDGIVAGLVSSGKLPSTNDNTMLLFVVPASTASTLYGARGCYDYAGYHAETQALVNGRHQPYAVNLQCDAAATTASGFDGLTVTISHEAAEAQTDPHPFSAPGWLNPDAPLGGEVADLCVFSDTTATVPATDTQPQTTYWLTTVYSQAAARSGDKEPCQPAPSGQPFYSVAVNPTTVDVVTDDTGSGDAEAAYEPFAYGDVGTISWAIEQPVGNGIKVSPSSGMARAGETIRMKIHASSAARSGSYPLILGVRAEKAKKTSYTATVTIH